MKAFLTFAAIAAFGVAGGAFTGKVLKPDVSATTECANGCEHDLDQRDQADSNSVDRETSYISLNNQFVVPIIDESRVASFVVIAISLEIETGSEETVYAQEPKLQDKLLRVMFDHAFMGGFSGAFTESERMLAFREALRETAASVIGEPLIDVLITEMVRQEA